MSLFGGLFKKKEKPQEPVTPHIDSPWGPFYFNGIKYNKFEYEGMVDWYDDIDDPCDITIECIAEGTDDMSVGYEKFLQLMDNKADIDYQVKMTALDYFADESGLVMSKKEKMLMSKDLFLDTMPISNISINRDGRIIFDIYRCDIPDVDSIAVIYSDNAPAVVEVLHYDENSYDFYNNL